MPMLTLKEIAERLKLHPNTLRRYVKQGKLPAMKFGRVWRVEEWDLNKFLEERKRIKEIKSGDEAEIKIIADDGSKQKEILFSISIY